MEQLPHNNETPEQKGLPFLDIEKRIKKLEQYNEMNELHIEAHQEYLKKMELSQSEDLEELADMYSYNESIDLANMHDAHKFSDEVISKLEKQIENGRLMILNVKQLIVDCITYRDTIETFIQSTLHQNHTLKKALVEVRIEDLN